LNNLKEDEIVICTNALSQKNTNKEKEWVLYRQKDQSQFLKAIGVRAVKVEPLMTNDAHIFFENSEECNRAKEILNNTSINGKKLFLLESCSQDPKKLFYRIEYADKVSQETPFQTKEKTLKFFDYFEEIVTRTGKHIPNGTLFSSVPLANDQIYNHQISDIVLNLFGVHENSLS